MWRCTFCCVSLKHTSSRICKTLSCFASWILEGDHSRLHSPWQRWAKVGHLSGLWACAPLSKTFTIEQKRMQNGEHQRVYGIFKAETAQCKIQIKYKIQNWKLVHWQVYGIFKAAALWNPTKHSKGHLPCPQIPAATVLGTISILVSPILGPNALCHFSPWVQFSTLIFKTL